MRTKTIKGKIVIAFSILMFVALFGVGIYLYYYFNSFYMDSLEEQLLDKARMLSQSAQDELRDGEGSTSNLQDYVISMGDETDYRFTIISSDGEVLAESERKPAELDNHLNRPEIQEALENGWGLNSRYSDTIGEEMLYAAVTIEIPDIDQINYARVAFPLTEIQNVRINIGLIILSGTLLALMLTWMFGSLIAQSITYPVEALIKWTDHISKGNLQAKSPVKTDDEIGELAVRFENMQSNLAEIMNDLTEEKNKISILVNNMPDGVIAVDNNGVVNLVNPTAKSMLNILDISHKKDKTLISITRNYDLHQAVQKVLFHNLQVSQEIHLDDSIIRVYATPLPDKSGAVLILQDITDLTRLEQMRKEFISNISHELKTPLTSIQGFVETIKEEYDSENQVHKEFLEIISKETRRITRLIDDLTTLSKLETNRENVELEKIEVKELLHRVVSIAAERWKYHNYIIYSNVITDELLGVMDNDKIQQVLLNLIDNACRHNSEGTKIKIKAVPTGEYIKFSITDNGEGIPEHELERIFERFYKIDKSRYSDYSGTGLGLSIAKHVLKVHNSELKVRSKYGYGTSFYFYLKRVV